MARQLRQHRDDIGAMRTRIGHLEQQLATANANTQAAQGAAQAAQAAQAAAQAQMAQAQAAHPAEGARPPPIRTHLPDKFEGRRSDWRNFIADVKSYCELTNLPAHLRVEFANRCLGQHPKTVWAAKRKVWEAAHAGAELSLDVFDQLMSTVYDNQDRATRARNKLDTVYQGSETLDKYIERVTTLFGEVEVFEPLSMGEKLHRFKKGLRADLQEKCVIDPHTGEPYTDLDVLMSALTKYEAALGAGQRPPKQRRVGGQLAATGHRTMDAQQQGRQYVDHVPLAQPPPLPQVVPQVAAAAGQQRHYPRRDGLPAENRQDFRTTPPSDRVCWHCNLQGHEQWQCPVKKWGMGEQLSADDENNVRMCMEMFREQKRIFPAFGSQRRRLPLPPGFHGGAQGGQGRGNNGGNRSNRAGRRERGRGY